MVASLALGLAPWLSSAQTAPALACPQGVEWTDEVVAKALDLDLSPERFENLKLARALDNETICTLPEAKLRRAIYRAENPKRPDQPAAWAQLRAMQQKDEAGLVKPEGLLQAFEERSAMVQQTLADQPDRVSAARAGVSATRWASIGPGNIGGRIRAIAIHPTNPSLIWVGSVSGGIWKSSDAGASWAPVNDFLASLSVSAIVISPTDPNVMYAGTGEGFFSNDAVRGAGVFKSLDGGLTWTRLAATNPATAPQWYYVNRLAIHPANGNVLLAATNNGVYRSADAGASWSLQSANVRIADVRFDPLNGNKAVYARLQSGYLAYSTNAGVSWTNSSLYAAGRAELAYSRQSGVLYASVDSNAAGVYNPSGRVYRSADGGATWTLRSSPLHLSNQGWYNNTVWVDPTDSNHVIVGGLDLYRSVDGAATWSRISQWSMSNSVHADHHAIVSAPGYNGSTNRTIYFGNDGGIYRAQDIAAVTSATTGWTKLNNGLAITQFYSGAGHSGTNGRIIGGTQDNGSLVYSGSGTNWTPFFSGDGGASAIDPTDGNYLYGEYGTLQLYRSTTGNASSTGFIYQGITDTPAGRANFVAPFVLDPNNPNTMLAGGESLWRSTNVKAAAPSWSYILAPTGGGGPTTYISQIAVAPTNSAQIWVGKNNGTLFKTSTGTQTLPAWSQMGSGVLPARMVLSLLIDKANPNIVYAGFGGYSRANLWRSNDGGASWTSIGTGLPASPVRAIARHPVNPAYLYVGTEVGVFTSDNGGATWSTVNDGPANVSVEDLFWLDGSTLVAATHGRGMFRINAVGTYTLSVGRSGTGSGTVASSPAGIDCGTACSASYNPATSVTLTAAPASGAVFAGWSGACSGTASTCTVSLSAAKSVTAAFTASTVKYTLSVSKSGAGSVTGSPAGINCGTVCSFAYPVSTQVKLTATPASGAVFAGWSGVCAGTAPTCTVSLSAAKSVGASFTASTQKYALTVARSGTGAGSVASSPAGISCGATCGASYTVSTTVTLTATPASGSAFAGWSGTCSGTAPTCTVSVSAVKSVAAEFALPKYALTAGKSGTGSGTVTSVPAGISCGATCSAGYTKGSSVVLTATPAGGSVFAGWSGACTGTASICTVSMSAAKSVSAGFTASAAKYTLSLSKSGTGSGTVTSSPAGISCGAACSAAYPVSASVTLTATPAANSAFSGWSGACTGTAATCTVSLSAARTVSAGFQPMSLASALDNAALAWSTSGDKAWFGQGAVASYGADAAQSGAILDAQSTRLRATVTGPGTLSFVWKVSSESGYDFLTLYLDGVAQSGKISGDINWAARSLAISAGTHTLEWVYSKDASLKVGSDAAWVDKVVFTPN